MWQASFKDTSDRHSLHSSGAPPSTIGTNRPVLLFSEYREFDANVSRLEHREHSRDEEVWGDTRRRLTGCRGSMLLVDEPGRRMPDRVSMVSHLGMLARLMEERTEPLELPSSCTSGEETLISGVVCSVRRLQSRQNGSKHIRETIAHSFFIAHNYYPTFFLLKSFITSY